jgi:hypothetical protein
VADGSTVFGFVLRLAGMVPVPVHRRKGSTAPPRSAAFAYAVLVVEFAAQVAAWDCGVRLRSS